jgi:hypothetical protein
VDIQRAYGSTRPVEVTFDANVRSSPSFFFGRRTRREHEAFEAQTTAGPVRIVDNVTIAQPVRVRPGDAIQVRGQLEPKPGAMPVVHWTHHDPSGRHIDGFIRFQGRVYA